jgi:pimeloyl-ACP methyl ester carboxylesterase
MRTTSFQVHIDQPVLDDLKSRILATRWLHEDLKKLADHWAVDFDWRKTEAAINAYPQFISEIDGYKIHYLHIKSGSAAALPLIISHGWPGSFLEMLRVIPLLTTDFNLVIPSLIGFGFSDKPKGPGVNATLMAGLWVKLMRELGYEKFVAQGGDFGAMISTRMAMKYSEHLLGLHLNYIPFSYQPYLPPGEELTAEEKEAQQQIATFFKAEGAYAQVQTTKPKVLSYGLNDSPVGLCAWLLEIFRSFSDPSRPLEELFNRDELLANITLYWVTRTIYSSIHLYGEIAKEPFRFGKDDFIHVPVGVAHYKYPVGFPARAYVERGYNVRYWSDLPKGGHFAAMEQPELFAADLKAFAKLLTSLT